MVAIVAHFHQSEDRRMDVEGYRKLHVRPYRVREPRRARRGQPGLEPKSLVWLITHRPTKSYFAFCYIDRREACKVARRLEACEYDRRPMLFEIMLDFNFRSDPELSLHVHKIQHEVT